MFTLVLVLVFIVYIIHTKYLIKDCKKREKELLLEIAQLKNLSEERMDTILRLRRLKRKVEDMLNSKKVM